MDAAPLTTPLSIRTVIDGVLSHMGVAIDSIELNASDVHPVYVVKTSQSGLLIGNNGENLRALNYIIKRIVEEKVEGGREHQFAIDVNGYYSRRLEEIKTQAKMLADRARTFKTNVELGPMNAYERMVVHALFTGDREIETKSEGQGRFRHVVLHYKNPAEGERDPEAEF